MACFDEEQTKAINQMWINVRCYNIHDMPGWVRVFAIAAVCVAAGIGIWRKKHSFYR